MKDKRNNENWNVRIVPADIGILFHFSFKEGINWWMENGIVIEIEREEDWENFK